MTEPLWRIEKLARERVAVAAYDRAVKAGHTAVEAAELAAVESGVHVHTVRVLIALRGR